MRRRKFLIGLGAAMALPSARPISLRAQQALPVIGILSGATFEGMGTWLTWFYQGLANQDYVENRDFTVQLRWADDNYDRMPGFAADLVRRKVNLIVTFDTPGSLAAKEATATIPIVFSVGTDPVEVGLVPSLARPGGNLTGVTNINVELLPKCLSLIHELLPAAAPIAVLLNPGNRRQFEKELPDVQAAARTLGVQLLVLNASKTSEIETAFATLASARAGALMVSGEALFFYYRDRLVALAARDAVPAIYAYREYTEAGGLISYGTKVANSYRQAGAYAGRVLKGEKPADLPVQRPARFETLLNLKTAKALGIEVPTTFLGRTDEVIE
jgi:putative ABC transport system substrate-binding protein